MENKFEASRLTIRTKLLAIILTIIVASLSLVIFLATYYFRDDAEKRVQENNLTIVGVIGQKIDSELNSNSFTLRSFANIQLSNTDFGVKRSYEEDLFKNHPNFLYVALLEQIDGSILQKQVYINKKYALENSLDKDSFIQVNRSFEDEYRKSFRGATVLWNASPGFVTPILGLSIPWNFKNTSYSIVVYIDSIEFLKTFQVTESNITYLVNESGMLLAHPKTEYVIEGKNFSEEPIVRALLESKIDNGQTKYKDLEGNVHLGSFKKLWNMGLGIISTIEADRAFEEVYNIQRRNLIFLAIVLNIAIVVVFLYSRTISNPIKLLVDATKQVELGNFKVEIEPKSGDEVGVLTHSFKSMAVGLEEREKVKSILGSMIDPVVVQEAMKDMQALKRGKEEEITAFFSDVASFSTISEQLTSVDLASLLNEYLSAMTIILKKHDGVLDKYIGDAIVAIFNAPVAVENHPLKAAKASVEMVAKLDDLRKYWVANNLYSKEAQEMTARIGLHIGPAKVGFMGTDDLASYTMMGDTVNLAARLEAAGKDYGVNILISENMNEKIKSEMFTKKLDMVRVKGKNEPVQLFELISSQSDAPSNLKENARLYENGFELYLKRNFKDAIHRLKEAESAKGSSDKAAKMLIERCNYFLENPPPGDWDGVFTRTTK
jgi:adenylate cyclase